MVGRMSTKPKFRRTTRYIRTHWPAFVGLYLALVAGVLLIGLSLAFDWYSFIPFSLAIMLVVAYFLVAYVYVAYRLNDPPGGTATEFLIDLAQLQAHHRVVCIDLGLKATAVTIAQHLTTGQVTVIDIYNPQSNIGGALRRARGRALRPPPDPRLNWIDGNIQLLPLPDRSTGAVFMNQILSEFWIPEEREQLLAEVRRILIPEGRLLVAERVRSLANPALTGIVTYPLPTEKEWLGALTKAGFILRRQENAGGVVYCVRVDRPSPTSGKQMLLDLEYD